MIRVLLGMILSTLGLSQAVAQGDQATAIAKILNSPSLWAKDFPAALASIPAWNRFGEQSIVVMPDRIIGGTAFKTSEAVEALRGGMRDAMVQQVPQPFPAFENLISRSASGVASLQTQIVPFSEDHSQRLAATAPEGQFLPPALTVRQVEEVAGKPEKITTEVIQTEGERRPVILTLRSYGAGAIVYAESDWAPTPGIVDRVILNIPAINGAVFREGR